MQPLKKKKDSKSIEKSPRDENEAGLNRSESDRASREGSEIMSPVDKTAKRNKLNEKKELKRRHSFSQANNSSTSEKSPHLNKNGKSDVVDKKEPEEDKFSLDGPKPTKVIKKNENIGQDISNSEPKKTEELNGVLEKQPSKPSNSPPSANNIFAHMANMNTNSTIINSINPINTVNPLDIMHPVNTTEDVTMLTMKEEFEGLHNLLIEKIVYNKSPSASGLGLEKSIENVISKINPETMSISEILENDLGKNIHTLLVLINELSGSTQRTGMNIESEFNSIRNKLLSYNDIIKNRLILHYVENVDYCSQWLKKLEQKREEKNREEKMIEEKKVELGKQKSQQTSKPSKRLEELEENVPPKNDDGPLLQINFEEYRYEDKGKKVLVDKAMKMVTTSTKINKPIYNTTYDTKKGEAKLKENVVNPTLRKKICLKMSKMLQDKYHVEKDTAQELTLKVEAKIRHINPDMLTEYKDKVLIVLKLLKYSMVDIEEYANNFKADFSILRERLDLYQKENADTHGDGGFGEDSPALTATKEISRETNMMLNKMS